MSDLRNIFTSKDFIINSNVIKCISNVDITLDEFLLVLYFINVSSYLDTKDIQDKLGFTEEKAFNTFTSLINKKYIDKIVYEWSKNGVKKKIKEEKSNNELFDYDWLEDNE